MGEWTEYLVSGFVQCLSVVAWPRRRARFELLFLVFVCFFGTLCRWLAAALHLGVGISSLVVLSAGGLNRTTRIAPAGPLQEPCRANGHSDGRNEGTQG